MKCAASDEVHDSSDSVQDFEIIGRRFFLFDVFQDLKSVTIKSLAVAITVALGYLGIGCASFVESITDSQVDTMIQAKLTNGLDFLVKQHHH